MKIDKKNFSQIYLERRKYKIEKKKLINFTDIELDIDLNDSNDPE